MMKKTTQNVIHEGSGSFGQKPTFYRMKNGLKKAGKFAAKALFTGFLTWAALTSSASSTQAQTKEVTQKIEVIEEGAKINLKNIENVEVKDGYLYIKSDGNSFRAKFTDALEKIGRVDSTKAEDNWVIAFGKYGILDITLDESGAQGRYIYTDKPLRDAYYDKKNRMSVGANEDGLGIIHPLGKLALSYGDIQKLLKKEINSSANLKIGQDLNNENSAIISFDGKPTLRILGDLRDPNGAIIDYIVEKIGSGN